MSSSAFCLPSVSGTPHMQRSYEIYLVALNLQICDEMFQPRLPLEMGQKCALERARDLPLVGGRQNNWPSLHGYREMSV